MSFKGRVLLVANTSWSFFKFRKRLIVNLLQNDYYVHLIGPEDDYVSELRAMGAIFHPLKKLDRKGTNPLSDIRLSIELFQLYRKIKPSLIFHYTIKPNIYGSIAAQLLRIPSIAVVTGLGYAFINKGVVSLVTSYLYKISLKRAVEVWFLNQDDADVFLKLRILGTSKVRIINGEGIDSKNEFNPENVQATDILRENCAPVRFLFIGRLLYDKGIREYVKAASTLIGKHGDVEFSILGFFDNNNPAGISEEQLDEWQKSGLINYLGGRADVRAVIMEHSCVVLPSYREGMSTVLQESASLGRPLIATNIPGCKELIDNNETGYLCLPKDGFDLADKMSKFLSLSQQERAWMGTLGRRKMLRDFDESIIFDVYKKKIKEFLPRPAESILHIGDK